MPNSKARFIVLKIVIAVMLAAILLKLFDLQVMKGEQYLEVATSRLTTNIVEKAPRGEILDRYGTALVTNKVGYSIVMQKTGMSDEELNEMLKKLVDILYLNNVEYYDSLPISFAPYNFEFEDTDEDGSVEREWNEWFENNKYTGKKIDQTMSAEAIINAYKEIYKVSDSYTEDEQRRIIGIRYEADTRGFSQTSPFTIADDVGVETVTEIKERQSEFQGISVTNDYVRQYNMPGLATHILGRTGKISSEEYEQYKDSGYGYNDIIGKQGIEKWAESYLRGQDGTTGSLKKVSGSEVTVADNIDPVPGDYVVLTIDSELQQVAEESLEKTIKSIQASGGVKDKDGSDCNAGAAVVIDVKTGDTLAIASNPTYDMSKFNEDYQSLVENSAKPLWNRAVSGSYSPGSTFKPLTAIAALQTGNLGVNEIIEDKGVYKYYQDYQPVCWIWSEYQTTHGKQNVTQALENSCNYFFYEVGRRMGISTLGEYAAKFGLGETTGIELDEETSGHMASPEYKKEIIKNVTSQDWYDGDTLQAAIGQSYSLFTPVQLANYTATIANGGTRFKVNLIKSIRSSSDGSVVKEFLPVIEDELDIDDDVLNTVKDGMKKVADEGSAAELFADYPVAIGGKTGTAQLGNGSNNAVFVAFAPFDDPEIAVAVVLEHGVRGTNAGYVAKDIFDKYFGLNTDTAATPQATTEAAATEKTNENNGLLR
jgi:penicillin-binding protein 2